MNNAQKHDYFRFHLPHVHLASVFGEDWFALKAEAFARFFGTPLFLISQTLLVVWIGLNVLGHVSFDPYPILLNLAFSLQAAYAATLILLAQTRQADRDKVNTDADAQASEQRQALAAQQSALILTLLEQNTHLTEMVKTMSERIEALTRDVHGRIIHQQPNINGNNHV